jgi:hypothetical protein
VTLTQEAARLAFLAAHEVQAARLAQTLVLAISGAGQWILGLDAAGARRKALVGAGYGWLAVASGKLLLEDLAGASTLARALALLGVGGIFLAAALIGNRRGQATGGAA